MAKAKVWRCAERLFDLEARPLIMGILNVTPDSFSDGGEHNTPEAALLHARRMRDEGADLIDVGGESTRPGFDEFGVSLEEERRRVLPVVRALAAEGFCVSVDTSKPEIMTEAAELGAAVLNDIRGFERPGALEAAARTNCGLVVMHRKAEPRYDDLVGEVTAYLEERTAKLFALGVSPDRICWDPGFGFGKTPDGNFTLLRETASFVERGYPFMTALSRNSPRIRKSRRTASREASRARSSAPRTAARFFACTTCGKRPMRSPYGVRPRGAPFEIDSQ